MDDGFEEATSANLPKVDGEMIDEFYKKNIDFLLPGVKNVKTQRGTRETYGDDAIGYVKLQREGKMCTVMARVTPEHKVRQAGYRVTVQINEEIEEITECKCLDCPASEGGCKHGVALLFWLFRRASQPSVTSVECYWRKSALSKVGSTLKGKRLSELFEKRAVEGQGQNNFLNAVVEEGLKSGSESILVSYFRTKTNSVHMISMYQLALKYKNNMNEAKRQINVDEFLQFCTQNITDEMSEEVKNVTVEQSKSKDWFDVRFGRITASKLHEVAHCKTVQGSTIFSVLGASKFKTTDAMRRGLSLENKVLEVVGHARNLTFEKVGFAVDKRYPVFGASADAITQKYVVEVKCPTKESTVANYIKDDCITPKPLAQIQLQMLLLKKSCGLFCVASPHFEINKQVTIIEVPFDENYCFNLMEQALAFWKTAVFPVLME